jgi:hypothetical protein
MEALLSYIEEKNAAIDATNSCLEHDDPELTSVCPSKAFGIPSQILTQREREGGKGGLRKWQCISTHNLNI